MRARNDVDSGRWEYGIQPATKRAESGWSLEGGNVERLSRRILVVDDSEPFRKFVCSVLKTIPNLQIIGEATDGLEAVHKSQQLQPDLILLDIGLPSLNGIEAARRIRKLSPESKILFGSQECSPDVVREALGTGAQGYFVKSDAGNELVQAVNAVLRGEQFIGKRFSGHDFGGESDAQLYPGAALQANAPRRDRTESNPIPARVQ
jgi:DNA-binding NarL/FixJ family response regulator